MPYTDLKKKLDEYNWDDGFEVPRTILADPDCNLALALEIFYLAGGYEYLENQCEEPNCKSGIHLLPFYMRTS